MSVCWGLQLGSDSGPCSESFPGYPYDLALMTLVGWSVFVLGQLGCDSKLHWWTLPI